MSEENNSSDPTKISVTSASEENESTVDNDKQSTVLKDQASEQVKTAEDNEDALSGKEESMPISEQPEQPVEAKLAPVVAHPDDTESTLASPPNESKEAEEDSKGMNTEPVASAVESVVSDSSQPTVGAVVDPDNHHSRNNKKLAAAVTVTIALVLAGIAVFVYLSTDNNAVKSDKPSVDNTAQQSNQEDLSAETDLPVDTGDDLDTTSEVTGDDLDDLDQTIGDTLDSLEDDSDFSEEDISDSTLGL